MRAQFGDGLDTSVTPQSWNCASLVDHETSGNSGVLVAEFELDDIMQVRVCERHSERRAVSRMASKPPTATAILHSMVESPTSMWVAARSIRGTYSLIPRRCL